MKADEIFNKLGFKKLEWKDEKGNINTVTYSKADRHIAIYAQNPVLMKVENRFEKVKPTEKEDEAIRLKIKEITNENNDTSALQK